jgi:hypothetical protein
VGWKADIEALKALGRAPRNHSQLQALLKSVNKESDKTLALICSALLEEGLEELLISRMVSLNSDERGRLFRGFGPLASYSRAAFAALFSADVRARFIVRPPRLMSVHPVWAQ